MARPARIDYEGAVQHVAVNGNNREAMFRDDRDRRDCLRLLGESAVRYRWQVWSYCLMDTHWHLLLRTPYITLTPGMRRLNSCYARRYNLRHERSGHSIRHRFMSVPVEDEAHLKELSRYLPLNPVRGGLVRDPEAWAWSSYRAELGLVRPPSWLHSLWWTRLHGSSNHLRSWVTAGMAEPGVHEWDARLGSGSYSSSTGGM